MSSGSWRKHKDGDPGADPAQTALQSRLQKVAQKKLNQMTAQKRETGKYGPIDCPDPVVFCEKHLGIKPWSKQVEIMRAVAEHPRVAVRSGHKCGKTTSAAAIALWWLSTRSRATVVLTSSGGRQVSEILWPEVRRLYKNA